MPKWADRANRILKGASNALEDIEEAGLVVTAKEFINSISNVVSRHGEGGEKGPEE